MSRAFTIAKKELASYFSSPTAFVFLGVYLFVSLFTFFWVEKFWLRNVADLRPLFEWMPVLFIFLIATLTMKMWSEERRMGTVEFLLTLPVKTYELVLGKFLACMGLVAIALSLTLGLAFSVGWLGDIDLGPIIGAYFASLLLASAYTAIGLYVSSKNESQIISLILTVAICSFVYMVGSDVVVGFFGNKSSDVLKFFGTGSRFSSISRGVVDFRDVYYYLSLTLTFIVANCYSMERLKWSLESNSRKHNEIGLYMALLCLNLLVANVWLSRVSGLRVDMTENKIYSISPATEQIIEQLEEPLLIRGYFSSRTHPYLAPLVPTLRDLLQEYKLAGKGKIRAEYVDPGENEQLEAEAKRRYGIESIAFQLGDRQSTQIVNSYFNIVVQYGDQHEVLSFNDLIEIKFDGLKEPDVKLRNPEYDISRSIKKAIHSFNNTDNLFASLKEQIKFVSYVSEKQLPKQLKTLNQDIQGALKDYQSKAGDKLVVENYDPIADPEVARSIGENYGFRPQSMSLFSTERFYFYLTLQYDNKIFSLGVPQDFSVSSFKQDMDATLKRLAPGFLRTAGIVAPVAPPQNPMMAQFGGAQNQGKQFRQLNRKLSENYSVKNVTIDNGMVPADVDVLIVLAPEGLNKKQVFAIDQFLMKGGTIVLSSSGVSVSRQGQKHVSRSHNSGLSDWLAHHGLEVPAELVLDSQNSGFPLVRRRNIGGITLAERYIAPYPFFVDVRSKGMNTENPMTSGLNDVNMTWPSPILVNQEKNKMRNVTVLLKSSENSWRSSDISIEPNQGLYPELGFPKGEELKSSNLAVMLEGQFSSYFSGQESPLIEKAKKKATTTSEKKDEKKDDGKGVVTSVLEKSPKIARIILFATNEFVTDETVQLAGMVRGSMYINNMQLLENAVDWSTADRTLLAIRSRGHFARTLPQISKESKSWWEVANYVFALMGLLLVYGVYRLQRKRSQDQFKEMNIVQGA